MQAAPQPPPVALAVPAGVQAPWLSLNPGPVVLLLLLPSIPLLLFGVGARPPNINHLPFSTGDVYATGALLTCAIAVVLGMAVWPDGLAGIWDWIKDDSHHSATAGIGLGGVVKEPGGMFGRTFLMTSPGPESKGGYGIGGSSRSHAVHDGIPGAPRSRYMLQQNDFGTQEQWVSPQLTPKLPRMDSLTALRTSFHPWYNPSRPHLPTALFFIICTLAMLLIALGHALGAAYDSDNHPSRSSHSSGTAKDKSQSKGARGAERSASGSKSRESDWVKREISKRREERSEPAKTEIRVRDETERERAEKKTREAKLSPTEFEAWRKDSEAKRAKDMDTLRGLLKREKLPLVALDPPNPSASKVGISKSKSKTKVTSGAFGSRVDPNPDGDGKGDVGQGQGQGGGWGNKIKRGIVGGALTQDLSSTTGIPKANKEKKVPAMVNGGAAAARVKGGGPAWEPANQAVVDATLKQSASNAQTNAARLKEEMHTR